MPLSPIDYPLEDPLDPFVGMGSDGDVRARDVVEAGE
jgi:hypothetical protein